MSECIGYMLHANILKKEIVDRLHALGMLISKSKNLCLPSDLAGVVGAVVNAMPNLKMGAFIAKAVD